MSSPAGPLLLGAGETALVILEFDRGLPQSIAGQPVRWEESCSRTAETRTQLEEYFAGSESNSPCRWIFAEPTFANVAGTSYYAFLTERRAPMPRSLALSDHRPLSVPSVRRTTTIPSRLSCRAIACWRQANVWGLRWWTARQSVAAQLGRRRVSRRHCHDGRLRARPRSRGLIIRSGDCARRRNKVPK